MSDDRENRKVEIKEEKTSAESAPTMGTMRFKPDILGQLLLTPSPQPHCKDSLDAQENVHSTMLNEMGGMKEVEQLWCFEQEGAHKLTYLHVW